MITILLKQFHHHLYACVTRIIILPHSLHSHLSYIEALAATLASLVYRGLRHTRISRILWHSPHSHLSYTAASEEPNTSSWSRYYWSPHLIARMVTTPHCPYGHHTSPHTRMVTTPHHPSRSVTPQDRSRNTTLHITLHIFKLHVTWRYVYNVT